MKMKKFFDNSVLRQANDRDNNLLSGSVEQGRWQRAA